MAKKKKVLFITSTRIGDAVLSTSVLNWLEHEYGADNLVVDVACGPLVAGFFRAFPYVRNVHAMKKQSFSGHWVKLYGRIWHQAWDMVIDLRNTAVSRMLISRKTHIFSSQYAKAPMHKVEQFAKLLNLPHGYNPKLYITDDLRDQARTLVTRDHPDQKIIAVCPTANWIGKTWPSEKFIVLLKRMLGDGMRDSDDILFKGAKVAIIAAPGEERMAAPVFNAFPDAMRINLIAKGSPELAAACIAECDFYIGNDSGLMHSAAALGVPTFGLFGPSKDIHYHPWGDHAAYIRTPQSVDELMGYDGFNAKSIVTSLMSDLSVDAVYDAVAGFIKKSMKKAA